MQVQGTNHPALHNSLLFTNKPHWIHSPPEELKSVGLLECGFKFQHIETVIDCTVCETTKGLIIKLHQNRRSLTPGQYAVLYKDKECLGSAKIIWSPTCFTTDWLKYWQEMQQKQTLSDSFVKYAVNDGTIFNNEDSSKDISQAKSGDN